MPPDEAESLELLMKRALAGDTHAYREVLVRSNALLRRYVARRIPTAASVEDVLQEILISVHKSRHTYDGNRPFTPWLYAIARYRLTDYLRSHYKDVLKHAHDIADYEHSLPEDVTETGVMAEYIEKAMSSLPEKQANIIRLIHHMGYTAKEAALHMGMSETAVKVSAHRAYKILKKKMVENDAT